MEKVIGYKIGMTRVFDNEGMVVPVTVVKVDKMLICQQKTKEKDGYESVVVGVGKKKHPSKAQSVFFKKRNVEVPQVIKEIRTESSSSFQLGSLVDTSLFEGTQFVDVTGTTKGRGFQGGMKRHGFRGGPATHGSRFHRIPGSIGVMFPQHVYKGRKMAGRMGGDRVTVQKLVLFKNDVKDGVLLIKGAIPGPNGGLVEVRKSVKA